MSEIDYAVRAIAEEVFDDSVGDLDDKIRDHVDRWEEDLDLGDSVSTELDYILSERISDCLKDPDVISSLVQGLGTYLDCRKEYFDTLSRGNSEKQKIIDDLQHQLDEIKERTDLLSVTDDAAPDPQQSSERPF